MAQQEANVWHLHRGRAEGKTSRAFASADQASPAVEVFAAAIEGGLLDIPLITGERLVFDDDRNFQSE
jgi:hypothetical protein